MMVQGLKRLVVLLLQDCCISSTAPVIASGLVDGQIVLHSYQAQQSQPEDGGASTCSTSYSSSEVFVRSSKKGASCRAVSFSADGQMLLAGFSTGTILQLDAGTGKVLTRMTKAHSSGINRMLALSGQQSLLAAGDESGGLSVWDLRSQSAVYQYSKHTDYMSGLAQHSPSSKQQGDMLVAVSGDGTLSVHDLRGGKVVARSETDADDELLSGEAEAHCISAVTACMA
jgi:WD40 repeat protein